MLLQVSEYLGPGRLVRLAGTRATVSLPDSHVEAQLATIGGVVPAPGDSVLVIGRGDAYYVIGVLESNGPLRIAVPRDLEIEALHGKVSIKSAQEVRLTTRRLSIRARRLDTVVRSVQETFENMATWVRDRLETRAGQMDTRVDGDSHLRARRIVELAEKDVRIDGESINLG
jgi:hypothetical protein